MMYPADIDNNTQRSNRLKRIACGPSLSSTSHRHSLLTIIRVILLAAMLAGCGPSVQDLKAVKYAPLAGGDWEVSTPAEQDLDPMVVAELFYNAARLDRLYALLVVRNGHLVAEGYFNEGSVDQKARLQSATKSITGALVGIALDQSLLSNLDQKMLDFFPEVADRITDQRKEQITIRQLLQMRAGFPWEESHPALWQGLLSGHYPPLIEEFPLVADPGTEFQYSNLSSNWLGILVSRVCGTDLKSYAEENLFLPIGAEAGEWDTDRDGHNNGCGDLHLTARDMARFGLLYLNDGEYGGKQVVPADWVRDSLQTYTEDAWDNIGPLRDIGYGYHWWSGRAGEHPVNFAWGHGGQLIVLVDDLNMVVVVTADPFYLVHSGKSWKHEKAHITLVGKFIEALPNQ